MKFSRGFPTKSPGKTIETIDMTNSDFKIEADNFEQAESDSWKTFGFSEDDSEKWKEEGFSLDDAIVWSKAGFDSAHTAFLFKNADFERVEEAYDIYKGLCDVYEEGENEVFDGLKLDFRKSNDSDTEKILENANGLLKQGVDPEGVVVLIYGGVEKKELKEWMDFGFQKDNDSIDEIIEWRKAGFSPEQSSQYQKEFEKLENKGDFEDALDFAMSKNKKGDDR